MVVRREITLSWKTSCSQARAGMCGGAPSCWNHRSSLVSRGSSTCCSICRYLSPFTETLEGNQWRITLPATTPTHAITFFPPCSLQGTSTSGSLGAQYRSFWRLGGCRRTNHFSSLQMSQKASGLDSSQLQKLTLPCLWAGVRGMVFLGL